MFRRFALRQKRHVQEVLPQLSFLSTTSDAQPKPKERKESVKGLGVVKKKKRVVFDAKRFRQPEEVDKQPPKYPYLHEDPDEDYYRRRFYPKLKEEDDPADKAHGLGGWRRRGTEKNYGRSFRESSDTRDEFIARYGVEALRPATKHRPFWETMDPGDLDDEKYFDEKEYIYTPIKPRPRSKIPKAMHQLVKSLCRFAREGNHFLAADLLDEGADCTKFDSSLWTPLHYACDRGRHAMVKLFLMKDPKIDILDYEKTSPLMTAARNGNFMVTQLLIAAKANLDLKDKMDRTALLLALAGSHDKVASLLLDAGADATVRDKDGWNAWHYISFRNTRQMAPVLKETEADINLQDFQGNTPLHWSASCGHSELCGQLVEYGADRKILNHDGEAPVHTAIRWAQERAMSALLTAKQDAELKNSEGETARELAKRLNHESLLARLDAVEPELAYEMEADLSPPQPSKMVLSSDAVTIHVSGRTFVTAKSTLEVIPDSYFCMMLHPEKQNKEKRRRTKLGQGPGKELRKVGDLEFVLNRDPNIFALILDLLRDVKYSNLQDVNLPEDKYEFGMLLNEAEFFRLPKIVESLKVHRRNRQTKSYRNVITEKQRRRKVSIGVSPALVSDTGEKYVPPSVEMARGNDQYRQWNPMKDPFAKNLPHMVTLPLPAKESARHRCAL